MSFIRCLSVLSVSLLVCSARAEDVSNPEFAAWAKFAVGSSATLQGPVGRMMTKDMRTLKEKADDRLVVEVINSYEMLGHEQKSKPVSRTVSKTLPKEDVSQEDDEKIEVGGKTYTCKVYMIKGLNMDVPDAKAKGWFSPDVPGGVVKLEVTTGRNVKVTLTLVSSEVKR